MDNKQLSDFHGNLYEGTRDEEEERLIHEAEELAELVKGLTKDED